MTRKGVFKALLLIGATVVSLSIIVSLPFFAVKTIEIETGPFVKEQSLAFYGNTLKGKTVFCVLWLGGFKDQMIQQLPALADLSIRPKFPSTLVIRATEKQPWVTFLGPYESIIIAKDGTILNDPSSAVTLDKLEDIIVIEGFPIETFRETHIPADLTRQLSQLVSHIQFYFPSTNLQMEFNSNELILVKDDRIPIKIGSLDNLDVKFRNLKSFLEKYPRPERLQYIDIRIEDRVVVK